MQNEQISPNFPHKNVIFLADSISGKYRVLETKDFLLPITGAILLNNVQVDTISSTINIEYYNQNVVFYEVTGASVSFSGLVQTQVPTNTWINLDSRTFSSAGDTVLTVDGPYSNIRIACTGYISGGMTASLQSRKI